MVHEKKNQDMFCTRIISWWKFYSSVLLLGKYSRPMLMDSALVDQTKHGLEMFRK